MRISVNRSIPLLLAISLLAACNNSNKDANTTDSAANVDVPPTLNYTVVKTYPHDTSAYTEGFLFHDGQLFESTGTEAASMPGRSSLFGTVDLTTGRITPKAELDRSKYFGEGIVFLHDKLYQLTYTTKIGFIYDARTFKKLGEFTFPSKEGWGMTTDGKYLIMSDGTSNINYFDPDSTHPEQVKIVYDDSTTVTKTLPSFRLVRVLGVTDNNGPVSNINELEMIKGFLYSNQWLTNYILKIDPESGKVVGRLDMDTLVADARNKYSEAESLNGIAYDSSTGKIYITGKLWPTIYEIKFPL
ncbi:MAG TPA: glutaminyl-peptide cyclotransferase [Puia sp.]|nr:glutaminyl-peptide cyclotransferase [Puia sp.]